MGFLFAEQGLGVSKVVGDLFGPCLFALNMGIGRSAYGFFGKRLNISIGIISCSVLTMICYLLTVFASLPIFSLFGCAVCGLGVSLMWPGVISMASEVFGKLTGPSLFAALALAGDIGCSVEPWITGTVSDGYAASNAVADSAAALRVGMLAASVFPLIMIFVSLIMAWKIRRKRIKSYKK